MVTVESILAANLKLFKVLAPGQLRKAAQLLVVVAKADRWGWFNVKSYNYV